MQPSRIAELLDPFLGPPDARRLAPDAFERISMYIDILQRWNARVNLTAIRNEEEIVTRHFGESLFTARNLFPRENEERPRATRAEDESRALAPEFQVMRQREHQLSARTGADDQRSPNDAVELADIGSGAGFPGIPIKLWAPEISLTLIESNHKKATFLREVARALTLMNVNIQNTRAESLAHLKFDVVTLRAVERFESILPIAANSVAHGGRLALLIGKSQLPQVSLADLTWSTPLPIPETQSRVLLIGRRPSTDTSTY